MNSLQYLKAELKKALQVENYERAALLRDRIAEWKRLEGSRSGDAQKHPPTMSEFLKNMPRKAFDDMFLITPFKMNFDPSPSPSREETRRTNDLEDMLRSQPPQIWDPSKLRHVLEGMTNAGKAAEDAGAALRQQLLEQHARMRRDTQDSIIKAVQEQVALYFGGLELDPYTMRGQVLRVIDHRDNTEAYHFRGRLLLMVDTGSEPWNIVKM
jgi:hypothetical protein